MFRRSLIFLTVYSILLGSVLIGSISTASASISVANDYLIELPNSNLVFVMLAPDNGPPIPPVFAAKEPEIREKYFSSGLYKSDNSAEPLWVADWYSYEDHVHITSDGTYVARLITNRNIEFDLGIAFYENGIQTKRYPISEITKRDLTLAYLDWNPALESADNEKFVSLRNQNEHTLLFDVQTGELESGRLLGTRNLIFTTLWLSIFFTIFAGLPLYGMYRLIRFFYRRASGR